MRIVSLVPSSTETLLALGADVVACTRFCEQPGLRHVGGTKNPDLDAIIDLEPDLVVLDREENRLEDHDALADAGLRVFVSDVRTLDDGYAVVDSLAAAAGLAAPDAAAAVAAVEAVPLRTRRRALVPIWRRPWMAISEGTYGASLLAHLGVDVVPVTDVPYPTLTEEQITAAGADTVLVPSEPYDFRADHVDELAMLLPDARIRRVDGRDLFWWGIRTPDAVSRLRSVLEHQPLG